MAYSHLVGYIHSNLFFRFRPILRIPSYSSIKSLNYEHLNNLYLNR